MPITVASICPLMTPAEPRANLDRLGDWTRKAAAAKPSSAQQHAFLELAEPVPGPTTERLEEEAKSARIYICAGLLGAYRKVQVGECEAWFSSPGDRFPVFDVKGVPVGILICRDKSFPEIARILALEGAKLLLNPHATADNDQRSFRDWSLRLCAVRAMENGCYLIANNCICTEPVAPDRHAGYNFAVVHCDGGAGDTEKMAMIEVDTAVVDRRRAEEGVHFNLWSRIPSMYKRLVDPTTPRAPDTGAGGRS